MGEMPIIFWFVPFPLVSIGFHSELYQAFCGATKSSSGLSLGLNLRKIRGDNRPQAFSLGVGNNPVENPVELGISFHEVYPRKPQNEPLCGSIRDDFYAF